MSEFVTLCHCGSLEAAQQARALLEAEGISVRIDGEHGSAIFGGFNTLLDVRVDVPPAQLEQAQRILDEFEGPSPDGDDGEVEQNDGDEREGNEAIGDDSDGEQVDGKADKMPDRLPTWMRRGKKFTWWGLGLGGFGSIMRGDPFEGGVMLVLAVLVWGLSQDSDENVEPDEVVAEGIGADAEGDADIDIEAP